MRDEDDLIRDIYNGVINVFKLPVGLYDEWGGTLAGAIDKGYAIQDDMQNELKENIKLFSAAKTFNFVYDASMLMMSGGKLLSFPAFREKARVLVNTYESWLRAEYETALGQAQMAAHWRTIMQTKDILPLLEYRSQRDGNVSPVCKSLDGIIQPVTSPFWATHSPLNHFNCRCEIRQLHQGEITDLRKKSYLDPEPEFANNPGVSGQAFNKKHPYFRVPKKYRDFARQNFGLPI